MLQLFLIVLPIAIILFIINSIKPQRNQVIGSLLPDNYSIILEEHVAFYRALNKEQKKKFENRIIDFLNTITIEGIRTTVEDIDKVFIAASAMIPMFGFDNWQYSNLTNVLVYPEHFNEEFELEGTERKVMGMVGTGAMNHKMILSQPALREGFKNETDKNNTAIHEFVHLLDKMDGDTDGIPQILLEKQYTIPWLNLMHKEIDAIVKNRSDINPYGATSKSEFFAVASEYFFERPELLKEKHPELFKLMQEIFDQTPAIQKKGAK